MGRGSGVRAASASSILIDFRYKGVRCREKLRLAPTPQNKKYVARLKATIEREIELGIFDYAKHFPDSKRALKLSSTPGAALTVAELLGAWLRSIRGEVEPETWGDYDEAIRNTLAPAFGTKRVNEMTIRLVKDWAASQDCSRKRILNVLTPLRRAFNETAIEEHYLDKDPLAGLRIKRVETDVEEDAKDIIDPFTPAELASALPHASAANANMFEFWAWSGLRTGELIALTWPDIDFERGVARVTKARRGRRLKTPKTAAGIREVRLLPPALEALQRHRAHTRLIGREIFLNPDTQKPWTGDKPVRNAWRAVLASAGVRYRYPYQLRHTFASWMLSGGESPLWVSKMMGHRDWSQIVKTYGRWIPEVDPDAGMRAYERIRLLK